LGEPLFRIAAGALPRQERETDDQSTAKRKMAITETILCPQRLTSLAELRQAGARLSERLFAPRELILRSDGEVSYLRLSSRAQKVAAGLAAATVAWGLFATASYVVDQHRLAAKDRTIASHELAYRDLEAEFTQALDERARLEAEIAGLSRSLSNEIEAGGKLAQRRAALEREATGLRHRLANLREAHQRVIERLRDLAMARADAIEDTIATTGLDADRLISSVAQTRLGRGGPEIPIREVVGLERHAALTDATVGLNKQWSRLFALTEVRRFLPLTAPLGQYWISSAYGERADPFTGKQSLHSGMDMVAPIGSAIRATAPGRVAFAGKRNRYGRLIVIDHGHGITTRYAHLGKILIEAGAWVERGQRIATLGNSGRSTGPHLHYEVRFRDRTLNPARFLEAGTRALEG
jgi:murein DD-endopeptidase MepM/ murein hydrolase activator NlpD